MINDEWHGSIEGFLKRGEFARNTQRVYRAHLSDFASFAVARGIQGPGACDIPLFGRYGEALDGLSRAARRQRVAAVRSFLGYLRRGFRVDSIPGDDAIKFLLPIPKAPVKEPYQILSEEEISSLVSAAESRSIYDEANQTRAGIPERDLALLALLMGCGLRCHEASQLCVPGLVDVGGKMLLEVTGKGSKVRRVPVGEDCRGVLFDYLESTGRQLGDPGPYLLAVDRAQESREPGLGERGIFDLITQLVQVAGVGKKVTPHSLRHTFGVRFLTSGGSIAALRRIMGHAKVETTMVYVDHVDLTELSSAMPVVFKGRGEPPE